METNENIFSLEILPLKSPDPVLEESSLEETSGFVSNLNVLPISSDMVLCYMEGYFSCVNDDEHGVFMFVFSVKYVAGSIIVP